ncbi:MAG: hypothetical protein C0513_00660 [Isosphaera sp.]|nr:hypothetical protein [Isosphaera sp.]
MPTPSAIVIGGGPAGACAAYWLRAAGVAVTLVERAPFPRHKPCGEFISPAATAELQAVAPGPALLAAGARRVSTLELVRAGRRVRWPLPVPAWSLSRAALDALLLAAAADPALPAPPLDLRQPAAVSQAWYTDTSAHVRLSDGAQLCADAVVHADGSGRHDPAGPAPSRRGVVGAKCHLRLRIDPDALVMHAPPVRGGYFGLVTIGPGLVTCAAVLQRGLLASDASIDRALRTLWPAYDPADRDGPWMACPVPGSGHIPAGHPRSFRVGNAAAGVEPVGGEGIGLAIWSGTRCARLLTAPGAPLSRGAAAGAEAMAALARTQARLARDYRRRLRLRRPACRAAAWVLEQPGLSAALWPLLSLPACTLAPWYALTGKPRRAITTGPAL